MYTSNKFIVYCFTAGLPRQSLWWEKLLQSSLSRTTITFCCWDPFFLSRSIYLELKVITDDPPLLVLSHHIPMKSHSITIQIPWKADFFKALHHFHLCPLVAFKRPMLKQLIATPGDQQRSLRGKAFECAALGALGRCLWRRLGIGIPLDSGLRKLVVFSMRTSKNSINKNQHVDHVDPCCKNQFTEIHW